MIERKDHVRITNNLKHKIVGRYDGEDYEFLPGKPLDVTFTVAQHIFGFGLDDKTVALSRLGWLTSSEGLERAMAKLNSITFSESPPLVEADADYFEEIEAETSTANRLPVPTGATAPPVSPEASGGGAAAKASVPKPHTR